MSNEWVKLAKYRAGDTGMPGSGYEIWKMVLWQRGDRYRCTVQHDHGSNQGYLESHGGQGFEGRGNSPEDAIDEIRDDVLEGLGEQAVNDVRQGFRRLLYDYEDRLDS